jgi:hypothetical protein
VVNDRVFTVVDRANLALIQQEMEFQLSGEVSDESAQSIGQKLGAQTIVSGSITPFGDLWRLTVRALGVEDATVLGLYNENIPGSSTLAALTSGPKTVEPVKTPAVASRTTPSTGASSGTQTAAAQAQVPAAQAATSTQSALPSPDGPFAVGNTGPAGGLIFYSADAGRTSSANPPVDREYNPGENGPASGVIFYNAAYNRTAKVPPPVDREYNPGENGPASGVVFYNAAYNRTAKASPPVDREYQLGDTGPGGGIIFFINPAAGDWKYLEAAPANTEKQTFWSAEVFSVDDIKGARSVGSGKPNSDYIMRQAIDRGGGFDWAAEVCDSLVVNGYDDWFLPSRDELHQMYGNLKRKGLGTFKDEVYWSSTPNGDRGSWDGMLRVWYENFSNGDQSCAGSDNIRGNMHVKYRVRAIRQF